jgi:hypothetical protein
MYRLWTSVRYHVAFTVLTTLASAIACSDSRGVAAAGFAPVAQDALRAAITGPAATRLTTRGTLTLDPTPDIGVPQIDSAAAAALATAWAHQHAAYLPLLARQHGAPITASTLHPCGRMYYVESAFQLLPAQPDPAMRRSFGPWWLVTLCGADSDPQVAMAVSSLATDLQVKRGKIAYPPGGGEYFHWMGVPVGMTAWPMDPEHAVVAGANATHRRVASVPHLIVATQLPQLARWRLTLDSSSLVQTRHGQTTATEVYVAADPRVGGSSTLVPSAHQPATVSFFESSGEASTPHRGAMRPQQQAFLSVRPGIALSLDTVAVGPPTGGH